MFWALKIACTMLGETGLFLVVVTAQLRADRLHAALYCTVIAATSTAGTTLSDSWTARPGSATSTAR
jgi:uncharacterized membrane-anchored protein